MERVASLMNDWARADGQEDDDVIRWTALGFLHDALKCAPEAELRDLVPPGSRDLPGPVLHGPAAAERLRRDGVEDESLLLAVAYHTLGHRRLDRPGRALYAADFLEPGRNLKNEWRAALRERMPHEMDAVVREIVRARVAHLLLQDRPVRPETMGLWNNLAGGEAWVRASEV
jgi:2-amino-4-hydroxy-6-hydroxymethyldihydropteridine diphosphokinase